MKARKAIIPCLASRPWCGIIAILTIEICIGLQTAQAQDLPASPVPVTQQPSGSVEPVQSTPVAPAPPVPVGPPMGPYGPLQPRLIPPPPPPPPGIYANPYQDTNGPLLRGDPLLETVPNRPRGLFAGLEADLVWPHIKNRVTGTLAIDGFTDTLHLPTASLDVTGSPLFILGYRFAEGCGEFTAKYRSLVTEGSRNIENFDFMGEGFLKSRLNVNVIDLDYGSQEIPLVTEAPGQLWDLKFDVGARIAGVYFDSSASGFALNQHTSNNFFGAGPHVSLEFYRYLQDFNGLALYGKVDTAVVIGRIKQNFRESFTFDGITGVNGASTVRGNQAVPMLGIEAGLSWTPTRTWRWLRFTGGYIFEQWWDVGTISGSSADLTYQGLFLRTELHF
jgi:hypothetical protein